jgi:hypothetical protein
MPEDSRHLETIGTTDTNDTTKTTETTASIGSADNPDSLDHVQTARLVMDLLHRTVMHHGLWFAEVAHQLGQERARELLADVLERSWSIQVKHLSRALGFAVEDGVPAPLLALAKNWLVNDGVWFQAVEFSRGMNDAKRCNDSCWARFSPVEAASIRRLLGLEKDCGLEGLRRAFQFRLYSCINEQTIAFEGDGALVLRMNRCRVQAARKRKGLDDYPCKSGGLVEYTTFAETIDPAIRTECLACPPDAHPEEWVCAWRFTMG